jgi:hypothetical protein
MSGLIDPDQSTQKLTSRHIEKQKIEAGWLGSFFGTNEQATKTISFVIISSLVIVGIVLSITKPWNEVSEYWKWIIPVITGYLGYLFGKG